MEVETNKKNMVRRYEIIDKYNDILEPSTIEKLLWFQDVIGYRIGHIRFVRFLIVLAEDILTRKGLRQSKLSRVLHWATGNSIFYIDYVNGLDANAGTSWGVAWKTINLGATAARIAPGDVIRIAKSPAPTSIGNATWNNKSITVTLASALTQTISDCEVAWTASTNVTCAVNTTNKEGTNSATFAVAAAFTTGKIAYRAIGSTLNLSGYQQVSFWVRTTAVVASGVLNLRLCSDTVGDTVVNTIAIPAIPGAGRWQVVTVNTGAALGSAIQSISLAAASDPGTPTIYLDNIIACKAAGSADSLTLSSLISKNSAEQGGSEGWYCIQSISGTTVKLDTETNTDASDGRGYYGTTETVTTYKRETIPTTPVGSATTSVQEVMDSGTVAGGKIQFQGGYDTGTGNQTGETFFDGKNGNGHGIYSTAKKYITLNYLNVCRYNIGILFSGVTTYGIEITNISNANNNTSYGVQFTGNNSIINTISNANNNGDAGVLLSYANNNIINTISNANNNNNSGSTSNCGVRFYISGNNIINTISNANNNINYGIRFEYSNNNIIRGLSTSENGYAGIYVIDGNNYFKNATINEATEATSFINFANASIFSEKHDGTAYSKIFTDGGNIVSEASTLTNGSGIQWKLTTEFNTDRQSNYPLTLKIAKIAVTANNLVTVSAWFKKGHATNIGARLVCKGGQIAGVPSDVITTKANNTSEEQLTITFTPTEAGVVEIEAQAFYVAGHSNVIVDAVTITQA